MSTPDALHTETLQLKLLRRAVGVWRQLPFPRIKGQLRRGWDWYEARNRNRIVTTTIDGVAYELDLSELIDNRMYYTGAFEPETTAAIRRFCKPGDTVLDIGANIGCHALRMAQLV